MTINQYNLYLGHAAKNIGGEFYSPKTVEQDGVVYSIVSKETQKKAVAFLMKELFITPKWLIDISILEKIGDDPIVIAGNLQGKYLDKLLSNQLLTNLISHEAIEGNKTYTTIELFADLKKGIWPELKTYHAIDVYRRNLQKRYIALLEKLVLGNTSPGEPVNIDPSSENIIFSVSNPLLSDISSIALAQLMDFQHEIKIAIPLIKDAKSSYHLKDVLQRINKIVKKHEN